MSWLQISLETTRNQVSLLEQLFNSLGALSVTLGDAGDEPLLEPPPQGEPLWQTTRVTGLFDGACDPEELRSRLDQALSPEASRTLRLQRLQDQVWERAWLEHFRPMRFGRRLWVCPHGQAVEVDDAVILKLDPGLAFGTGSHPTTALCLGWLDGLELHDQTLIDYGCGSGILAVAALRLGARRAIAVDHDPQALQATRDNAQCNGVAERLQVYAPEELPALRGDYLVANILAAPLIELAPRLLGLLAPQGHFALSGILQEQQTEVSAPYRRQARLAPPQVQGEWLLLTGQKGP